MKFYFSSQKFHFILQNFIVQQFIYFILGKLNVIFFTNYLYDTYRY